MMPVFLLLLPWLQPASPAPEAQRPAAVADRCLPGNDGFLTMRLRGSIEADIAWREPELHCTGMSRPDGRGLRLRFAGQLAGAGELTIVFAAPELGRGESARGVPVNVTLIDAAGKRIYGTQGGGRCLFDEVEQRLLQEAIVPPDSYRVSARGFCTVPAPAIDGEGAVLLTRFDFAGLVIYGDDNTAPPIVATKP